MDTTNYYHLYFVKYTICLKSNKTKYINISQMSEELYY